MTFDEALPLVNERYGLQDTYVTDTGLMIYVIAAERELRKIPEVKSPESGIGVLKSEVIELAGNRITVEALVRRKNPELFCAK
jgi:hypothetical protein